MIDEKTSQGLEGEKEYKSAVEATNEYIENFDILETITNVGNDEVFTPRRTCEMMLDSLPEEVWHNPNYKWLNPATKNGVFEREIALRLDKGLEDIIKNKEERRKHILQNMIFAIGQTKFTANVARRTLYYCSKANQKPDERQRSKEDGHYLNGFAIGKGTWFDDEEGNIKTPHLDHEYVDSSNKKMPINCEEEKKKKYRCKYCCIAANSKYSDKNQLETYAYEFIHAEKDNILWYLQDLFFEGDKSMKFDIIIGNPPYQLADGGAQASARPIYNLFVDQAKALHPKYLCMIIPSRWMTGGKGLDEFRNSMINDKHICLLHDYVDPKECFPNNEIKGGVCYFLWDKNHTDKCTIYTHRDGDIYKSERYLKEGSIDVFVRDERLISLVEKSLAYKGGSFSKIVSPLKPYGLRGDIFKDPSKYSLPPMSETPISNGITIHGLDEHLKRVKRYVPQNYPIPKNNLINGYKLFVARNQGSGVFGETLSEAIIAGDNEICTETYVVFGPLKTKGEAENCWEYVKTKFFRAMLGIRKLDQGAAQGVYQYVPLIDFKKHWTEKELYSFFNLSESEIKFIEENVQEMV